MNKKSVLLFHKSNGDLLIESLKTCKNLHINLFECKNLSNLNELYKIIVPTFIILDNNTLNEDELISFAKLHFDSFIFTLNDLKVNLKNIIFCSSIEDMKNKFVNLNKRIDNNILYGKNISSCYNFITNQLDKYNFSKKHIGSTYLKEIIMQLYLSSSSLHYSLKDIYPYVSSKFNCTTLTIEKSIRFSIDKAYSKCKKEGLVLLEFKNKPTVKEMTTYLLDKFISTQI